MECWGAAVVQKSVCAWVVQLTLCLVLGYGVLWGFMPMWECLHVQKQEC